MTQYLLSVHSVAADAGEPVNPEPVTPEQMRQMMEQVGALQAEMKAAGAWVFGGRLTEPATATVVRRSGSEVMTTDGPFVEAREHLGGFYIIEAQELFLQVKEATRSVLEDHHTESRTARRGGRGQRMMQAPATSSWAGPRGVKANRFLDWRQLPDMKAPP